MTTIVRERQFSRLTLIGGCGSSGTTLLVHLLSRHPLVGSGPEFNCFNHPELYDLELLRRAWPSFRVARARPAGYIDVPVFMTHRAHYALNESLIEDWLTTAATTADFVECVRSHLKLTLHCQLVAEKSPSNVYCFNLAHEALPGVRLVHVVRDGRDVVVSLMRRGFNLFGAGSRWLYDTIQGIQARGRAGYCEVRYEDLVTDPETVTSRVLEHIGVQCENRSAVLGTGNGATYEEDWRARPEPRAWNLTPSDPVSARSVGQYRSALSDQDLANLNAVALTGPIEATPGTLCTFGDLLTDLGYAPSAGIPTRRSSRASRRALEMQDYARRARRFWSRRYWKMPRRFTKFA